jgi:hypothetical protein
MARKLEDNPYADIGTAEENPYADIGAPSPAGRELLRQGIDVAKQIPSAVVGAAESALTFPAQATGLLGGLVEKIPGFAPSPEQAADRAKLLELTEGARKPLTRYVPDPETRAGQLTRQGVETAITTGLSPFRGGLSVPRAAGVGATAGVTGEAARQATEGTAAEPYAQIGGALVGGIGAARQAERAAAKAALPTIAETKTVGGAQYDAFRNSGFGIDPAAGQQFSGALKAELNTRGLTDSKIIAEGTHDILDKIAKQPFTTPQKFHEAYQELGAAARSTNPTERQAASIAQERLLAMLEKMPPNFITGGDPRVGALLLQQANQNWAAAKRAENVSGRIAKAEQVASGQYSGLGLENELRRRMGVLGLPPEAVAGRPPSRGFTEAERRQFEHFGEGTALQNLRRQVTGYLGGRGGIATTVVGGGGVGLGSYLSGGDPTLGAALGAGLPLAGLGLAKLSNRSALNRARDLERMLLARSELAMRPGRIPQPATGFPLTTLAPTLANLGEGE